jgi:hypothetical protein
MQSPFEDPSTSRIFHTANYSQFADRQHPDGRWDAICKSCFRTVAADLPATCVADLEEAKGNHVCKSPLAVRGSSFPTTPR